MRYSYCGDYDDEVVYLK